MNGGRKEDFMNLTLDEVQLIFTTHSAMQAAHISRIADVFSTMFGGK